MSIYYYFKGVVDDYRTHRTKRVILSNKYLFKVNTMPYYEEGCYFALSTEVSVCTFIQRHILPLDCDNEKSYEIARNYLDAEQIAYSVFSSSPSKYWVITDIVGSHSKCIEYAEKILSIGGIDEKYLNMSKSQGRFYLRAAPYDCKVPKLLIQNNQNTVARDFVTKLNEYYTSKLFQDAAEYFKVVYSIRNGTFTELISNPGFQL